MPKPTLHCFRHRSLRGFTLIELLVTISIIALIIGFSIPVLSRFFSQADVERTRILLQQLAGIETEYRAQSGSQIPLDNPEDAPLEEPGGNRTSITRFIQQIDQFGDTQEMADRTLNRDLYTPTRLDSPDSDENGGGFVNDPWGNRIEYRVSSDGISLQTVAPSSATGVSETGVVFPPQATPFFASAGPDGLWGNHGDYGNPDEAAQDNIYSFDQQ